MLFPISDGLRSDGDLDDVEATVPVICPSCKVEEQVPVADLTSHNGQEK